MAASTHRRQWPLRHTGAIGDLASGTIQTGAKALFRRRALFGDQFARRRCRRPSQTSVGADTSIRHPRKRRGLEGMCSGKVVCLRLPLIRSAAIRSPSGRFRGSSRSAGRRLRRGRSDGEWCRSVVVSVDLDLITDADAAHATELVRLGRQWL